jgi:iron-sulfur cluster assembly protein
MITVTETAADKIRHLLEEQGHPEYGLRMGVAEGGCSGFQYHLAFESTAGEADQVVEVSGVRIFIDSKSGEYLGGAILDYQDGLMGAGFKIENPNVQTTCRCGESFCA